MIRAWTRRWKGQAPETAPVPSQPRIIRPSKLRAALAQLGEHVPLLDAMTRKHHAYAALFLGPTDRRFGNAKVVWDDLAKFCGDNREGLVVSPITKQSDPYASAFLAGKQAVFKRIKHYTYLNLDVETDNVPTTINTDDAGGSS